MATGRAWEQTAFRPPARCPIHCSSGPAGIRGPGEGRRETSPPLPRRLDLRWPGNKGGGDLNPTTGQAGGAGDGRGWPHPSPSHPPLVRAPPPFTVDSPGLGGLAWPLPTSPRDHTHARVPTPSRTRPGLIAPPPGPHIVRSVDFRLPDPHTAGIRAPIQRLTTLYSLNEVAIHRPVFQT